MATQLKNLKFGDYTLKGETNLSGGMDYKLGNSDTLTYEYTYEGVTQEEPIIDLSWSLGCSTVWHFHGGADYAGCASTAGAVGSSSGSALYYDSDSYVWKFEGVANSALGFVERTQGSPGYYQFYEAITPPSTVPRDGSDAATWIAGLLASLNGHNLITCVQSE